MSKGANGIKAAAVTLAAGLLALALGGLARAGDKPQLNGRWSFNAEQSDDAEQKVQQAQTDSKVRPGTDDGNYPSQGGTYPGGGGTGGGYPIGGRGPMGGLGIPGIGRGTGRGTGRNSTRSGSGVSSEEWERLAANPKYLHVAQLSDKIEVTDDAGRIETFYPDGKKHDDKDASGNKTSTKSDWEGSVFVAETKLSHSEKLTQSFRTSQDGKQLFVTTRFEAPTLAAPLSIQRVYDREKAAAAQ
jgi:hypothetical protein